MVISISLNNFPHDNVLLYVCIYMYVYIYIYMCIMYIYYLNPSVYVNISKYYYRSFYIYPCILYVYIYISIYDINMYIVFPNKVPDVSAK